MMDRQKRGAAAALLVAPTGSEVPPRQDTEAAAGMVCERVCESRQW